VLLGELPRSLAARPELLPLRHAIATRAGVAAEPAARAAYRSTLARNLLLGAALDEALGALVDAGVAVQPAKGALFVELLYEGDAGARPMSDLDLLVRPEDLERAHGVMMELGYTWPGAGRARFMPRYTHHRQFQRGRVLVELHFRLVHELAVDADCRAFFHETREIRFRGRRLQVARDELLLYHTLLHAATHGLLHSALWLIDAHLLALRAGAGLDWDHVVRHARAHRSYRAVKEAARLVNAAFPGSLPALPPERGLRDRVLAWLLAPGAPVRDGPNLRSLALRALLTDSSWGAARMLGEKAVLRGLEAFE